MNLLGRGRILDQLDQVIAEDDPARRDGDILARNEVLGANRRFALDLAAHVLAPVVEAGDEVLPAGFPRPLQDFRIGVGIVRGGKDVQ